MKFSSVQSLNHGQLFVTPWIAACQAFLSITNSWNLLKLMSIRLVMPSDHLILCCPLLLPPSIFTSIRVFSSESVLCIRCQSIGLLLAKQYLCFLICYSLVIAFLPRSKHFLMSWLQSPIDILQLRKIKSLNCFHCFPIYLP